MRRFVDFSLGHNFRRNTIDWNIILFNDCSIENHVVIRSPLNCKVCKIFCGEIFFDLSFPFSHLNTGKIVAFACHVDSAFQLVLTCCYSFSTNCIIQIYALRVFQWLPVVHSLSLRESLGPILGSRLPKTTTTLKRTRKRGLYSKEIYCFVISKAEYIFFIQPVTVQFVELGVIMVVCRISDLRPLHTFDKFTSMWLNIETI